MRVVVAEACKTNELIRSVSDGSAREWGPREVNNANLLP